MREAQAVKRRDASFKRTAELAQLNTVKAAFARRDREERKKGSTS